MRDHENSGGLTRRRFVGSAAVGTTAAAIAAAQQQTVPAPLQRRGTIPPAPDAPFEHNELPLRVRPFPLTRVRLSEGPCRQAQEINRKLLHELPNDRLIHNFRVNAGLASSAQPLGGWEKPDVELRGHFTGHYLSACALMYQSTGDQALKQKAAAMVAELAKCQQALGDGYLSAFPAEFLDRLKTGTRVWAPFYTYHKIMAGMLDMATLADNPQALEVAEGMARWVGKWLEGVNDELMTRILRVEFGGMNEALYNLYAVTGRREYAEWAHRFDHPQFFEPLAQHRDDLTGLHANTQVPKVIGAARRYELSRQHRYRTIAEFFWYTVVSGRTYVTGGTSNNEGWRAEPGRLAAELALNCEECCVSYNMMKLTRRLFTWTADPRYADYYERHLYNTRLGTQHPEDGGLMYYLPLLSGYWKTFGTKYDAFWCCTGTGVEEFAKLGDSIYFHGDDELFVNLFIASELDWSEKGARLRQQTKFPEQEGTTLVIETARPVEFALNLRVPYWATRGPTVRVNGSASSVSRSPSSYMVLRRVWKNGDRVELSLPMSLHVAALPDDPTQQAILYGPMVLAGLLGKVSKEQIYGRLGRNTQPAPAPGLSVASPDPGAWIEPVSGQPLTFRTVGQAEDVTLVPFHRVFDQKYAIYWKVNFRKA